MNPFGADIYFWLIFADWLDENGEPERAELVRSELDSVDTSWNWEYRGGGSIGGGSGIDVGVGDSGIGGS